MADGLGFDFGRMEGQTPQLFPYDHTLQNQGSLYDDSLGAGDETNDAKRRRIARVRFIP